MNRLFVILALVSAVLASGCWLAAIPRFKVIKHPVTTTEAAGRWVLSAESQKSMAIDGFIKKDGQEFAITLRPDGSCSYHTVLQGRYVEKNGQWSLRYDPSDYYKNRLDFRFGDEAVSLMSIASDSLGMVLWESWGDPDAGVDLVYRKEQNGATNGSQPNRSEKDRTSPAVGSDR